MTKINCQLSNLVESAKSGDTESLTRLILAYSVYVHGIIFGMVKNRDDTADLCQEVWISVTQKIHTLRNAGCFPAWLKVIATRTTLNFMERRRFQPISGLDIDSMADHSDCSEPSNILIRQEEAEIVQSALLQLRPMDLESLYAFYFHGMSLVEMTEDLSAPLGTIKRRLHVARKRLHSHLKAIDA